MAANDATPLVHNGVMSVDRELHGLIDDVLSDRPATALAAYRRLVDDQLPWLERRAVVTARRQGLSWAGIGRLLGRSHQSLIKRLGHTMKIDELVAPARPALHGDEYQRDLDESIDRVHRQLRLQQMEDDDAVVPW